MYYKTIKKKEIISKKTIAKIPIIINTKICIIKLGLTKEETPEKIEKDLTKFVPKDYWTTLGHHFVDHGRAICDARKPKCEACVLSDICNFAKNKRK